MRLIATILAASALLAPVAAFAAPVTGGSSVFRVLVPIFPVQVSAIAPATDSGATCTDASEGSSGTICDLNFPILGGDVTLTDAGSFGATGNLMHDGGVRFVVPAGIGLPPATLEFNDIKVNFDTNEITADYFINGLLDLNDGLFLTFLGPVSSAQLTNLSSPLLQVNITSLTASVLNGVGLPVAAGDRFGTVATSPRFDLEVPAPAALALFGLGIVGLGLRRR